jgi:hypothetical protein
MNDEVRKFFYNGTQVNSCIGNVDECNRCSGTVRSGVNVKDAVIFGVLVIASLFSSLLYLNSSHRSLDFDLVALLDIVDKSTQWGQLQAPQKLVRSVQYTTIIRA